MLGKASWASSSNSPSKVAASFNYASIGISPARFVPDPSFEIDPKNFQGGDDRRRFPASALVEFRGDWKFVKAPGLTITFWLSCVGVEVHVGVIRAWVQELFGLSSGWNSAFLCHHCKAHDSSYLSFPCRLPMNQRRDAASFQELCKPSADGEPCDMAGCSCLCAHMTRYMTLCRDQVIF